MSREDENQNYCVESLLTGFHPDSGIAVQGKLLSRVDRFLDVQGKNRQTALLSRVEPGQKPTSIEGCPPVGRRLPGREYLRRFIGHLIEGGWLESREVD